ncbi:MAG: alpha/beta hydrolase [Methylotenera sp.]|nr:alpha/beta hydrolase [Oligoflexia bacterium]
MKNEMKRENRNESVRLSLRDGVERLAVRLLMNLPGPVQILLSGRKAVVHENNTLSPQLQLMLAMRARRKRKPLSEISLEQARRGLLRDSQVHAARPIAVGAVSDLQIPAAHGLITARHYSPAAAAGSGPVPLLVFFHGGGFALCDLETHDAPCRYLCQRMGMQILSVDYRLAPEFPFPAALEDAFTSWVWAEKNAMKLGVDPERISIGGDSAGANLAAVVCQLAAAEAQKLPLAQLLFYPVTDRTRHYASMDHFAEGFFLTRADIEYFKELYAPEAKVPDFRLFPLIAKSLSGQPPAVVVTAGFDPLRDEGEAFAEALGRAGVRTDLLRLPSMIHGFMNFMEISSECRDAMAKSADHFTALCTALGASNRSSNA